MNYDARGCYTGTHRPSGEEWWIIGISVDRNEVCAAGWPPTIGRLEDIDDLKFCRRITEEELQHRRLKFGDDSLWAGGNDERRG